MIHETSSNSSGRGVGWLFPLLLLTSLAAPGCFRSHTIEPGTWRLVIKATEGSDHIQTKPIESQTQLTVDWGKEPQTEVLKLVYNQPPSENQPEEKTYILKGTLKEGKKVDLQGHTDFWDLQFFGDLKRPDLMSGNVFARGRHRDQLYFNGGWQAVKVKPR